MLFSAWLVATAAAVTDPTVVEKLNGQLPLEIELTDSNGVQHTLRGLLDGRTPIVVTPVYYGCPALCGLVLDGVAVALAQSGLEPGTDFRVVTFSIDPSDTPALAASRRASSLKTLGADRGWDFYVGRQRDVSTLADALGFGYRFDETSHQFVHPAAFMVLTPDGRISRYFYGVQPEPRDLRLALVEASSGRVGTALDRLELLCSRYDVGKRASAMSASGFMRAGGALIFVGVVALLGSLWRKDVKR